MFEDRDLDVGEEREKERVFSEEVFEDDLDFKKGLEQLPI